jgi:serine kinase of HPr protein (carbohydrate metabolism regulator)
MFVQKFRLQKRTGFFAHDINIAIDMIGKKELTYISNLVAEEFDIDFKNEAHEIFGIY